MRVIESLLAAAVPPAAIQPVVNRAPRHLRAKAEIAGALASLLPAGTAIAAPLFLPERRIDEAFRDGRLLPRQIVQPVTGAWTAIAHRAAEVERAQVEPVPITPGSLGSWPEPDEEFLDR